MANAHSRRKGITTTITKVDGRTGMWTGRFSHSPMVNRYAVT